MNKLSETEKSALKEKLKVDLSFLEKSNNTQSLILPPEPVQKLVFKDDPGPP